MILCLCEHNEEMLSQNFDPLLRRRDVLLSSRVECDGHGDHVPWKCRDEDYIHLRMMT